MSGKYDHLYRDDDLWVEGVNVCVLLDQCEKLASPIRASTRSFQYASALDNAATVIKALSGPQQ